LQGLRVSLLGQGRLEVDGQALTRLLAPKHQALVFVLAAEGVPWPRQRLAALLWGELDEAAARGNLRGALSRLRRWLPEVLVVDAHEVGLADAAAVQVDLRALCRAQDPALPHAERVAAAEAWRGPLLDGFDIGAAEAFEDWLAAARQRARRDIVALRHDLLARAEAAGRADEAIVHARALMDVDDADEEAHMTLMRLLAALGRRTAAIAQYEACRAALAQRLGARPSAACHTLYVRIHADVAGAIAGDPAAGPDKAGEPATPSPSPTGAIGPLTQVVPEAAAMPAPVPTAAPRLIGREHELALVAQRLAEPACRWLTIVGPGGVGKTRLALAAAAAHGAAQRHGVLVLSGRDDAGGALHDAQTLLQQVLARIGSDRSAPGALLLVLDNLETVPVAARFEPLLRERSPGVAVLATSRRRIGGGREWLLELDGLSLKRSDPARPASSAAAALFTAAVRRLVPGFDPLADPALGATVERICALVGGLPLALEMAARGVHLAGAAVVAERLAAGAPLAAADCDPADHHHSLDMVMEDSWALLDASARQAALRLAQLPGGFDLALAQASGVDATTLATLRDEAWLRRDDDAHDGWLALHPLQQAWLRRRADPPLAGEVASAVAAWLALRLPQPAPFGDLGPDEPWPALADAAAASAPVLRFALRRLVAEAEAEALVRWIDAAAALLQRAGRQAEAAALVGEALARSDLPRWRIAGWRLRRAELLDGHGAATAALRERRAAWCALDLPDLAAEDAGWGDVLRATLAMRRRRDWPPPGPARDAFGALLALGTIHAANALTFLPDPGPMMRVGALADAACRTARLPPVVPRIVAAWGAASLGHPALARWQARAVIGSRTLPAMPTRRLAALVATGRVGVRLALGDWAGLAPEIDRVADDLHGLQSGRHEMEVRSLGAKLAFYEGRLAEAWERFAQMTELGMQRPGEAWRAWGPIGQCEVGLCLGGLDEALLQSLFDRASMLLTEMENVDAAYVLRRQGLAARLAWRRGDAEAALDAVRAGAAAAARTRLFGFWAHEGLAGLGDTLVALAASNGADNAPLPPAVGAGWSALAPVLRAHVRRFPPGASLHSRIDGGMAVAAGRGDAGRRLLRQAVALADRQGARVDQARACEGLAAAEPDAGAAGPSARRAAALWKSMSARGAHAQGNT
jgi:DNA-binding SARP family transcriptional activator